MWAAFYNAAGTILQTRRSMEFKTPEGQRQAIRTMNNFGLDGLIVIGGDGSLSGAHKLAEQGIKVVGVPAASITTSGAPTCASAWIPASTPSWMPSTSCADTASSHNRAFLVEVMGRNCGYLAVMAGLTCGAELVLIPENPIPVEEVVKSVSDAYLRGKAHAIIIVAEGFKTKINDLAAALEKESVGFESRVSILGHIQRGGKPTAYERIIATRFGVKAVEFILEGKTDVMTGLQGRDMVAVPLEEIISNHRVVSEEYYEMTKMLAR